MIEKVYMFSGTLISKKETSRITNKPPDGENVPWKIDIFEISVPELVTRFITPLSRQTTNGTNDIED